MRIRISFILFSIILGILMASILASAECPNCFRNVERMSGHDTTADGRRRIHVQIATSGEGSWNDPGTNTTNTNIFNGVRDAMADWNNTTTTGTSTGQHGNYFLEFNQSTTKPDIRIVLGTPSPDLIAEARGEKKPGFTTVGPPFTIILPAEAKNWSAETLRARIAHELGHALGVAHPDKGCGATIMNGPGPGNTQITNNVQPKDIVEQRKQFNTPTDCTEKLDWKIGLTGTPTPTPTPIPTPTPDPGCLDQDHDGVCFFDDCDDHNPAVAFDSDGDHYCYPYDCDDYDSRVYPGAPLNYNTEGGEDRNCNGIDDYVEQFGSGPGGGSQPCTPYYWVYYESLDGGYTWEVIDIQYAGCW
jgi:hypothetical protein